MISIPHPSKSFTFLVANLAPLDFAIPAIIASNWLIGLPDNFLMAHISAKQFADSLSNDRIFPLKSSSKILTIAFIFSVFFFPSGRIATPYNNSALVMVVVKIICFDNNKIQSIIF